MIGQLIMAQIMLALQKRDFKRIKDYPAVHLYIDEAQHLVSHETTEMINEFRKFGFNLTLATQYVDQFPPKILEAVLGLGVQIAGFCAGGNLQTMNSVFELTHKSKDLDETVLLKNQTVGHFYLQSRGAEDAPPIKTRQFVTSTNLLFKGPKWRAENAERYMTDDEWNETVQQQLTRYYAKRTDLDRSTATRGDGAASSPQDKSDVSDLGVRPALQPRKGYGSS